MANELLKKFGCNSCITTLDQCNFNFFVDVYEAMLGEKLPGILYVLIEQLIINGIIRKL